MVRRPLNFTEPRMIRGIIALGSLVLVCAPAWADEAKPFTQNFDADKAGTLPTGWTLGESSTTAAAVADAAEAPSPPNALRIAFVGRALSDPPSLSAEFPEINLDGAHGVLEYSFDVKVESIATNNSEGLQFRVWSGVSGIDVAMPRILRWEQKWRIYNHSAAPNTGHYYGDFDFGEWHRLRFVIEPSSPSAGKATWYADGKLLYVEQYKDRTPAQTAGVHLFTVTPVSGGGENNTVVYLDNLRIGPPEADRRGP